jgi:hypothetical protein
VLRKFVAVGEEQPAAFQVEEVFFGREVRGGVGFKPRLGGMPVAFADLVTELVQHDVDIPIWKIKLRSTKAVPRQPRVGFAAVFSEFILRRAVEYDFQPRDSGLVT